MPAVPSVALSPDGRLVAIQRWDPERQAHAIWIGDLSRAFLNGVGTGPEGAIVTLTIPHMLYMAFQATFCIITAALISGAVVERMRFSAYVTFISLWSVVIYAPIAHWVWGGGWLAQMGALDFAGGTVVHVNAGIAALVAAIVVGKRRDYPSSSLLPHSVPLTLLGAGLLWFGWFGFNAGSAVAANGIAGLAFTTTMLAPAATLVVWTFCDMLRSKKATAVGAATAIVVGLVAVTPAAGFISPMNAIILGGIAAIPSYLALMIRAKTSLDDSLDVVAAHGVGGTVGALLTAIGVTEIYRIEPTDALRQTAWIVVGVAACGEGGGGEEDPLLPPAEREAMASSDHIAKVVAADVNPAICVRSVSNGCLPARSVVRFVTSSWACVCDAAAALTVTSVSLFAASSVTVTVER